MKKNHQKFYLLTVFIFLAQITFADCSAPPTLSNVDMYFYDHDLGIYTIYLRPTLDAIIANQTGSGNPYYEKTWTGSCPGGLIGDDDSCIEFTVYPAATNFSPGNIMTKIEHYTHGKPNRGEVRIITDNGETQYVYTTDHENTFCGPYKINA